MEGLGLSQGGPRGVCPPFWTPEKPAALEALARKAGAAIMAHFEASGACPATPKDDGTYVTQADHDSQAILLEGLASLTPDIPVVAEEKDNPPSLAATGTWWLVDPLDGTREFRRGGQEFVVSLALLVDNRPCVGLLYAPALDQLVYGDPRGVFALGKDRLRRPLTQQPQAGPEALRLLTSRREARNLPVQDWLAARKAQSWKGCSSGLKYMLLACDEADIFPHPGRTCEWDTAAGDAILRALGGAIVTPPDGLPLAYGKPGFRNGPFLALRSTEQTPPLLQPFLQALRL